MLPKIRKDKQYRITIEEVGTEQDSMQTLQFQYQDREDLFMVVNKLKQGCDLDPETATKLGVALRLLGPVMMNNHKHPLFADLMPHFKNFMQNLKSTIKESMKE